MASDRRLLLLAGTPAHRKARRKDAPDDQYNSERPSLQSWSVGLASPRNRRLCLRAVSGSAAAPSAGSELSPEADSDTEADLRGFAGLPPHGLRHAQTAAHSGPAAAQSGANGSPLRLWYSLATASCAVSVRSRAQSDRHASQTLPVLRPRASTAIVCSRMSLDSPSKYLLQMKERKRTRFVERLISGWLNSRSSSLRSSSKAPEDAERAAPLESWRLKTCPHRHPTLSGRILVCRSISATALSILLFTQALGGKRLFPQEKATLHQLQT